MLFQKNIVKKYIALLDEALTAKAWEQYESYFLNKDIQANIHKIKEEQFQEGFLRELFVKVLGYTINPSPDYNLTTELKNEVGTKKADGAIMIGDKVTGVIELKDHKTPDLASIENQAFGYKSKHKDTRLVVISNFEKLRLYIDNAVEYREWDIFHMTRDEFRELYLSLAWTQVERGIALQMKDESVSTEDQITNALYKDYSQFKRALFADIVAQNPYSLYHAENAETADNSADEKQWQLLLFKKTQKLLDRLLFIFFAEDCDLLPPNSMVKIIDQWEQLKDMDAYVPFYDRVKKYFGYMNTGYQGKKYEIFAYNGGLFKPDDVLDRIRISDDVLVEYTKRLSTYDFESDVDVNILGHIFENSLSEIEEVTQQINSGQAPHTSKRKQDGVFYTPQYITKYIVENTVGRLCAEKKQELNIVEDEYFSDQRRQLQTKKRLLDQLRQYRQWLLEITILDPACGSGAFLNAALRFLMDEHKHLDEMEAKVTGSAFVFQDVENSILEKNLYGVDINEESVEIAQLALWLRTAKPRRKLNTLNQNIKCGNSLISDPAIAGEKAFDWQKEFPQVFEKGGFDVVIGNPPYVNVEKMSAKDKEYYKNEYQSFYKRSDLFALFVEQGLKLAKAKMGFIIPSIVLNNLSYAPLRDFFLNERWLKEVSYVGGGVFDDATVDTSILLFDKQGVDTITLRYAVDFFNPVVREVAADYFKTFKNTISIGNDESDTISDKMFIADYTSVDEHYTVFQGIVTGNNDAFIFENEQDATEKGVEKELLHTLCHGRDIGKWETRSLERKILYLNKDININNYQGAHQWLSPMKETLSARRECAKGTIPWYSLQWPRIKSELDIQEKILIQNTRNESLKTRIVATIDKHGVYASQGINFVIPKTNEYSIYFLLALLNSKLMNHLFSKKFLNLAIKAEYIKQIRFPKLAPDAQHPFIALADTMLSLNSQLQEKRSRFLRRMGDNFEGLKITAALQHFDQMDFKGLMAELKKQKLNIPLKQQDEWEDFFNDRVAECREIAAQIQATDEEIDARVFDLYGLTPEEREIVMNG